MFFYEKMKESSTTIKIVSQNVNVIENKLTKNRQNGNRTPFGYI